MIVKVYYNKTLEMSTGKVASQVAHAVTELLYRDDSIPDKIIVLESRLSKMQDKIKEGKEDGLWISEQYDKDLTEVESGTLTAVAWVEWE